MKFEYDPAKNAANQKKHGVSFEMAKRAFSDPRCVIIEDITHSGQEDRFFCFGKVDGQIMTVRFTWRKDKARIFGAAYWRKGKKIYEQENSL